MNPIARLFLLGLFLTAMPTATHAAAPATPPVAMPAFLDYVTFQYASGDDENKIIVTTSPTLQRIDELNDGYSVIYNPLTEFYIGLENRNYTYWEFSWPEVKTAVENSKRYEKRLLDLGNEGMNADNPSPSTNSVTPNTANLAAAAASSSAGSDDSGIVWRPTTDQIKVAGLPCVRWLGESVSGEKVEAWCYAGHLPKVEAAIAQLRRISDPMALVPVRIVAPDFIYPVYEALGKGGVTPLLIKWGEDNERHDFRLLESKTREYKPSLFTVPKLFMKTTLVTMDGMIDSQPAQGPRGTNAAPRVDHLTPPTPNPNP
jgi:hypothetical protein